MDSIETAGPRSRGPAIAADRAKRATAAALLLAGAAFIAGMLLRPKQAQGAPPSCSEALPARTTAIVPRSRLQPAPAQPRQAAEPRSSADAALRHRAAVARQLNGAAAVLAFAVLSDSGLEHYRGMFFNRAMYVPLVVSSLTLAASAHGVGDQQPEKHRGRDAIYALAALTGCVGTGFHIYNIGKRPGALAWQNLFFGAPLGAPMALLLAGLLGAAAERVRDADRAAQPRLAGIPEGRAVAAVTAAGLLGTVGEVALFHFRGAYHDPFMFLPVSLPPLAALGIGGAALGRDGSPHPLTRALLRITMALGVAGVGFHAYGISRNMGGWRNWSQNLLNGPPLPAPPSFTGLALAGLAALRLLEKRG